MRKRVTIILLIIVLITMATIFIINYTTKNKNDEGVVVEFSDGANNSKTMQKMKEMTQEDLIIAIENITDAQLVEIAFGANGVLSKNLYQIETFGVDFIEHETIQESKEKSVSYLQEDLKIIDRSVDSFQEALQIARTVWNHDNASIIEYIGENDLYYELRAKYSRLFTNTSKNIFGKIKTTTDETIYSDRMIFYKSNIFKIEEKPTPAGYSQPTYYSFSNGVFQKKDYSTVLAIMDIKYGNCLYRYMEENDNEYMYIRYYIETVGGDYGLNSTASLTKQIVRIDKNTGKITYEKPIKIKEDVEFSNFTIK